MIDGLINHLRECHNEKINTYSRNFATFKEFNEWKELHQVESESSFVLHCSPKQRENYLIYYYYCNRTGQYNGKGKQVRSLKQQGSSKLGYHCSAYMKVKEYVSGKVEAEICDHHIHEKLVAHLPLPESCRKMIAAKLNDGVSVSSILDFVRENVEGQMGRRELVNRQDITNISHQYNIQGIKLHADDAKSVSLWVENINNYCNDDNNNPVLLFKPQGVVPDDNMKDLKNDDFVICIQTSFQRDMLMKFGPEAVCMDSTHGTNVYSFNLITILVLDEFGEGIPVAWMVCNREDATVLRPFFEKIKENCGDVCTKVFMSDDANNFYNAWKSVFSVTDTKKLICAWHVDKSWRKGLQQHITDTTKQADVYHHLRVLLEEREVISFWQRLQQFISWLSENEDLSSFLQYFQREYVKKAEQWAPCYRENCIVNTNMALEAFHRVLKVCYLEKKQNRRIDYLLHFLLKVSRDKVFERFSKTQKGKSSHRSCEINKRHKTAKKMCAADGILSVSDGIWQMKPTTPQQAYYLVEKKLDNCSCKLRCRSCDVCVHMFSCTCMDFLIHSTVCKHIHLVRMSSLSQNQSRDEHSSSHPESTPLQLTSNTEDYLEQMISEDTESVSDRTSSQGSDVEAEVQITQQCLLQEKTGNISNVTPIDKGDLSSVDYLSNCIASKTDSEVSTAKKKAVETCKKIEVVLSSFTSNVEAVRGAQKHLNAALAIIDAKDTDTDTFTVRKRAAPNSNIEKQLRFHSTKKQRTHKERLSKPTEEELAKCQDELAETEIGVCGLCLYDSDRQHGVKVDWIQCDTCGMWFHQLCAEVTALTEKFHCRFCMSA